MGNARTLVVAVMSRGYCCNIILRQFRHVGELMKLKMSIDKLFSMCYNNFLLQSINQSIYQSINQSINQSIFSVA